MRLTQFFISAGLGVTLVGLFGCSCIRSWMRPDPPVLTAFLPHHELLVRQPAEFPLDYFWQEKGVDWNKYPNIYVAPVNTDHVMKDEWWAKVSIASLDKVKREMPEVADFMRQVFIKELRKVENRGGFNVVNHPGPNTVTLELALTQLVPTKAELNYLGTTAGFFVPGVSLATGAAAAGNVCFEGKLVDSQTGNVLVMVADRENDPTAVISLVSYTWYGAAEYNMGVWARNAAAMSVAARQEDLQRDFPIKLIAY